MFGVLAVASAPMVAVELAVASRRRRLPESAAAAAVSGICRPTVR